MDPLPAGSHGSPSLTRRCRSISMRSKFGRASATLPTSFLSRYGTAKVVTISKLAANVCLEDNNSAARENCAAGCVAATLCTDADINPDASRPIKNDDFILFLELTSVAEP